MGALNTAAFHFPLYPFPAVHTFLQEKQRQKSCKWEARKRKNMRSKEGEKKSSKPSREDERKEVRNEL